MNESKTKTRIVAPVIALLVTALALVLSVAGTAQAALDKQSNAYEATVSLSSLNVSLVENGSVVASSEGNSDGVLLGNLLGDDEKLAVGKFYDEELAAKVNENSEPEYVKVTVRQYWLDENGDKDTSLSPALLQIGWANEGSWIRTQEASDESETSILYSKNALQPGEVLAFIDRLRVRPAILDDVEIVEVDAELADNIATDGYTKYVTVNHKGGMFGIQVEVDGVQTHNAADAIKSAWGVDAAALGINV